MNILVSRYNVKNICLLIAYISLFPPEKDNCRILSSFWSCRNLRHLFTTISPVLDGKSEAEILAAIEPMDEILPGLYASAAKCEKLKNLIKSDFVNFSLCVNPQLFKLMEVSV